MLLHIMTSFIIYIKEESAISGEILDSYQVINDVIIWIDIIHFPVIVLEQKCQLFSYNIRYK